MHDVAWESPCHDSEGGAATGCCQQQRHRECWVEEPDWWSTVWADEGAFVCIIMMIVVE